MEGGECLHVHTTAAATSHGRTSTHVKQSSQVAGCERRTCAASLALCDEHTPQLTSVTAHEPKQSMTIMPAPGLHHVFMSWVPTQRQAPQHNGRHVHACAATR